jgi:hypothetical protein
MRSTVTVHYGVARSASRHLSKTACSRMKSSAPGAELRTTMLPAEQQTLHAREPQYSTTCTMQAP